MVQSQLLQSALTQCVVTVHFKGGCPSSYGIGFQRDLRVFCIYRVDVTQ